MLCGIIALIAMVYTAIQVVNQTFREPTVAAWSDCRQGEAIKGAGCLFVVFSNGVPAQRVDACDIEHVYGDKGLGRCPASKTIEFKSGNKVHVAVSSGASSVRLILYPGTIKSGVNLGKPKSEMDLEQLPDEEMTHGSRFFKFTAPPARDGLRYAELELRNGDYRTARVPFRYKFSAMPNTGP